MLEPTEATVINSLRASKLAYERTGVTRLLRDALTEARRSMTPDAIADELGMSRDDLANIVPE
jgi:hypothetical protein